MRAEAQLVERRELRRLLDPALDGVLALQRAGLRGDEAEHDGLALGQEAQRLEAAGAVAVPFHEVAIHRHRVEQHLRHRLVAAGGDEGGAEIAAAEMHGDQQVGGLLRQRRRHHAGIDLRLAVRIVPALAQHLPLRRIAEIGEGDVVELQIAAARPVHVGDRGGIGAADIGVEFLHVGIQAGLHHLPPAPVMQHRRAGDGHLRRVLRLGGEIAEMRHHRVRRVAHLVADAERLRHADATLEVHPAVAVLGGDAGQALQEVEMPIGPAELAIGHAPQPDRFLLRDQRRDLPVLDLLQVGQADAAGQGSLPRGLERAGAQQAADMVGAEGAKAGHSILQS